MSISFSDNDNDEVITRASSLPEDTNEGSLRPRSLTEYIGQEKAKGNLEIFINAAKMRGECEKLHQYEDLQKTAQLILDRGE